jgi:DNA-binding IclR family transcriptional regulator
VERDIAEAITSVHTHGYCAATWQPEVVALATPIELANAPVYVLNMSVTTTEPLAAVVAELCQPLRDLRQAIQAGLAP